MISGFTSDLQYEELRPETEVWGSGSTSRDTEVISVGDDVYGGGSNDDPVIISDPIPSPTPSPEPEPDRNPRPEPTPEPEPDRTPRPKPEPTKYSPDEQPTMPTPDPVINRFNGNEFNTERLKQFYDDNKLLVLSSGAFIGLIVLMK